MAFSTLLRITPSLRAKRCSYPRLQEFPNGINFLPFTEFGGRAPPGHDFAGHANRVGSKAVGKELGLAKDAELWCRGRYPKTAKKDGYMSSLRNLDIHLQILHEVATNKNGQKSVLNLSWGSTVRDPNPTGFKQAYQIRLSGRPHLRDS